jgi:hypothetical protein
MSLTFEYAGKTIVLSFKPVIIPKKEKICLTVKTCYPSSMKR